MRGAAAWLVAGWIAASCGGGARGPEDVVKSYFRLLGADPVRTLPLLTTEFHRQHALRVVTTAEARAWLRGAREVPAEDSAALATDRFQIAWLAVQMRPELVALARGLRAEPLAARERGPGRMEVSARVTPLAAPPFEQILTLARAAGSGAWRIDRVEQRGVTEANRSAAFAAHPSEAGRAQLEEALRAGARPRPR